MTSRNCDAYGITSDNWVKTTETARSIQNTSNALLYFIVLIS